LVDLARTQLGEPAGPNTGLSNTAFLMLMRRMGRANCDEGRRMSAPDHFASYCDFTTTI